VSVIRADLSGSTICTAAGITVDVSSPVLAMCRKLTAAGYDPTLRLECYRGDVLALTVRSIGEGARLEVNSGGTGFVAARAVRAAPPVRLKHPAGIRGLEKAVTGLVGAFAP
jgi:hypothetical protein